MKNKKLLASLVLAWIITSGISYSFADESSTTWKKMFGRWNSFFWENQNLTDEQKVEREELKAIIEKKKSWEELSDDEEAKLDAIKSNWKWNMIWNSNKSWKMWRVMLNNLTDDEKTALESMTDDEKKAFFDTKREEKEAEREAHENVIDKVLAWDSLTSEEEAIKNEIIEKRAEREVEREARETERAEMEPIFEKLKNSEELSDTEQVKLDEFKADRQGWKGWKWWKGWMWGRWMHR